MNVKIYFTSTTAYARIAKTVGLERAENVRMRIWRGRSGAGADLPHSRYGRGGVSLPSRRPPKGGPLWRRKPAGQGRGAALRPRPILEINFCVRAVRIRHRPVRRAFTRQ